MEDYKEKYEMALEKAKTLLSKCKRVSDKTSMIYRVEDIENMFPEFQKPEEERIKEALIELVKCNERSGYTLLNNVSTSSMINWLEKQGKETISQPKNNDKNLKNVLIRFFEDRYPKAMEIYDGDFTVTVGQILAWLEKQSESNPYSGVSFKFNDHTWGMCARDNGVEISIDNELKAFVSIDKSFIYPIHPQPYLAPKSASQAIKEIVVDNANKVELKFQEGDFIKHNKSDIIYKVFSIDNNSYFLKNIETDEIAGEFERFNLEQNFHLWTIKDAKDGDVLSYKTDEGDLWIMIYWSLYEPYEGHVHYHALLVKDDFTDKGTCYICIDNLKPATKEQRDLLFQKMKESGYEWDAVKKQLKEIEK